MLLKLFLRIGAIILQPYGLRMLLIPTTSGAIIAHISGQAYFIDPLEDTSEQNGTTFVRGFNTLVHFLVGPGGDASRKFVYSEIDRVAGTDLVEASAASAQSKAMPTNISQG